MEIIDLQPVKLNALLAGNLNDALIKSMERKMKQNLITETWTPLVKVPEKSTG